MDDVVALLIEESEKKAKRLSLDGLNSHHRLWMLFASREVDEERAIRVRLAGISWREIVKRLGGLG